MRRPVGRGPAAHDLDDEALVDDHRRVGLVDRDRPLRGIRRHARIDEASQRARDAVAGRGAGVVEGHGVVGRDGQRAAGDLGPLAAEQRVH
ncbi:hypothetical protein ESO86_09285 [Agromyces binzhouensis]|uniref:Uncharacterized protein n=1 Tax=Agromyces binzhouensis TaxID=1817495 RepID=A0A4Q2JMI4_9MICO|nr:hypothetical protein ESO86_09285 [Agromyces binzhouensis]